MARKEVVAMVVLGAAAVAAWAALRSSTFATVSESMGRVHGLLPRTATLSGDGKKLSFVIPVGVGPGRLRIRWVGTCDPRFTNVVDLDGAADEQWDERWTVAANGDSQVELRCDNPRPWGGRHLDIVPSAHCQAGTAQLDSPAP